MNKQSTNEFLLRQREWKSGLNTIEKMKVAVVEMVMVVVIVIVVVVVVLLLGHHPQTSNAQSAKKV